MDELMHDLSGNAKLRPIVDDNEGDVALWNKEIAKYFQGASPHDTDYAMLIVL